MQIPISKTLPICEWSGSSANGGRALTINNIQILLWESMIRLDKDPNMTYPGGGTLTNAYWRTLLADTIVDVTSKCATRLNSEHFDDCLVWREYLKEGKKL
jgi:hypothetical protein